MKLLVVEDTAPLRDMLCAHLREQGFAVTAAANGAQALRALRSGAHDGMILDLGLPDIDGMDILRTVRARGGMPALILTARDGLAHRVAGLDGGADDYILKPFELSEFDARLRAVLRRPGLRETPLLLAGDVDFDLASRRLGRSGASVDLTPREAALFDELARRPEHVVVRDTLLDRLYGLDDDVSGNALEASVSRLRRKLQGLGSAIQIETVRGIGYRLRCAPGAA